MRLFITLLCLVVTTYGTQAQLTQAVIQSEKVTTDQTNSLEEYFTDYKIIEIDAAAVMAQLKVRSFNHQLAIDLGDDDRWFLNLYTLDIIGEDFKINENGRMVDLEEDIFSYTGTDKNYPGKNVKLTIGPDYIGGHFPSGNTVKYIEPLRRFIDGAAMNQYVVYPKSAVVSRETSCGVNDTAIQPGAPNIPSATRRAGECFIVDLSVAVDRALFNRYGSVGAVTAHVTNNMINVDEDYTGPFTNDVTFQVNEVFIPASAAQDPVPSGITASGQVLDDFADWAVAGNFGMAHDLGQFLTARDFDGSTVGVAYSRPPTNGNPGAAVCDDPIKYHIIQDFQNNSDGLRAVISHEIGHNWGADHTNSGIMTASINFSNPPFGWNNFSVTQISTGIQFVADNENCLASCCVPGQPPVAFFSLTNNLICAGNSVAYNDLSENCPTSVNWTFGAASPSSSTSPNPVVLYNTQGTYTATLVASNGGGSSAPASIDINVLNPGTTGCTIGGTAGNAGIGRFSLNGRTITTGTASQDAANNSLPKLGNKVVDLACAELIEVAPGATYQAQVSIALGFPSQNVRVYLDLNQNASFESNERLININYSVPGGTGFATGSFDITIPNGLSPNRIYRLRVIADTQGGGGCAVAGAGQAEDYGVVFLNGALLPVSLQSFTGNRVDKVVELSWATASETNNDYFSLERSADGRNFETITEVNGAGDATTLLNYSFTDRQPLSGENYYRLKQTDFDGAYEYVGDIVLVKMPLANEIKIFPNPIAGEVVQVNIATETDQLTQLEIYSINGQLMQIRQVGLYAGSQSVEINASDLPRGVYLLRTQIDGEVITTRFVKGE